MAEIKLTPVRCIYTAVIGLLPPLLKKSKYLKEIMAKNDSSQNFEFYMVAASSHFLLTAPESYRGEHEKIRKELSQITKDFPKATDNLIKFCTKNVNVKNISDAALLSVVGIWVLTNLKKGIPTNDEINELAYTLGSKAADFAALCRN